MLDDATHRRPWDDHPSGPPGVPKRLAAAPTGENALLRQQLIVAARAVTRPKFRGYERGLIVFFAAFARHWANALLLVRPETIARWLWVVKTQLRRQNRDHAASLVYRWCNPPTLGSSTTRPTERGSTGRDSGQPLATDW
jgi:hypothetical protein